MRLTDLVEYFEAERKQKRRSVNYLKQVYKNKEASELKRKSPNKIKVVFYNLGFIFNKGNKEDLALALSIYLDNGFVKESELSDLLNNLKSKLK